MTALKSPQFFLDRKPVIDALGKAVVKNLSKFGVFVRQAARSSIRKRKRPSAPGSPPSSHIGTLKRLIFFAFDPQTKSVVIGPEALGTSVSGAPEVLEHGGQMRTRPRRARKIGRRGPIALEGRRPVIVTLKSAAMVRRAQSIDTAMSAGPRPTIARRPYMGPAFEQALKDLPPMWADSVR
jgi:hypothetical protein